MKNFIPKEIYDFPEIEEEKERSKREKFIAWQEKSDRIIRDIFTGVGALTCIYVFLYVVWHIVKFIIGLI